MHPGCRHDKVQIATHCANRTVTAIGSDVIIRLN
jgi:hypothetical protein